MAEVPGAPYEPFPTAQPTERPIPLPEPRISGAAFGENIANAVRTFGGDVDRVGQEVSDRALALRQLQVDGQIRDAVTDTYNRVSPIQADFLSKQGVDANGDALNAHNVAIDQAIQQGREQAKAFGLYGLNQFNTDAAAFQRSMLVESTRHSAQQTKVAQDSSITSSIAAIHDRMRSSTDPEEFNFLKTQLSKLVAVQGGINGWAQPTTDNNTHVVLSRGIAENISGQLERNPEQGIQRAQDAFNSGTLTGADADRLYRETQQAGVLAARGWVTHAFAGNSVTLGEAPGLAVPLIRESLKATEGWPEKGPLIRDPRSPYYGQKATPGGVMPGNLPGWLKEAGMPPMTVEEYSRDANAQNQLMDFKINQWLSDPKYNVHNANDVASMWFTGHPLTPGTLSASDHYHNGSWYIPKFNQSLAHNMSQREFADAARAHGDAIKTDMVPDLGETYAEAASSGRERQASQRRQDVVDYHTDIDTQVMSGKWKSGNDVLQDPSWSDMQRRGNALGIPDYVKSIPEMVDRWNKQEKVYTGDAEHDRLIDEAYNPETQDKFLDENLILNKNIKKSDIPMFKALQKEIAGGNVNRAFGDALRTLKDTYSTEVPDRTQDHDGYVKYIGALHRIMQVYAEQKKGQPFTTKDYEDIHHLLVNQVARSGVGGYLGMTDPFYKTDIPEDFVDDGKAAGRSDADIENDWWAGRGLELWNKYHGTNSRARLFRPKPSIPAQQVSLQVPAPQVPVTAAVGPQPQPFQRISEQTAVSEAEAEALERLGRERQEAAGARAQKRREEEAL